MQPSRRIASNLLWTPQGILRNPLLTLADDGRILSVATCDAPDRESYVEFYAGLLVAYFPADYRAAFDRLRALPDTSLPELLAELTHPAVDSVLVVISGLDYDPLRLTPDSRIRLLY